jgi:hypothetical protein
VSAATKPRESLSRLQDRHPPVPGIDGDVQFDARPEHLDDGGLGRRRRPEIDVGEGNHRVAAAEALGGDGSANR